jgi:hypothetical protein
MTRPHVSGATMPWHGLPCRLVFNMALSKRKRFSACLLSSGDRVIGFAPVAREMLDYCQTDRATSTASESLAI